MTTTAKSSVKSQPSETATSSNFPSLPTYVTTAWQSAFSLPIILAAQSLRFASQRMKANADYLEGLAKCHSVTEFVETQSLYAEKTVSDYQAGIEQMAQEVQHALPVSQAA